VPSEQSFPTSFLICRSRSRLCALPLQHVRETMRALPLDTVPNMPGFMLGVSVIRGQVVPVLDLASLTGTGSTGSAARYITLELERRQVALAVDEVIGVRSLAAAALDGVPPLLDGADALALAALTTLDAELLLVLQTGVLVPDALWPLLAAQDAAA
jgi:purine-binding chemotaxis protein CheW